MQKAMFTIDKSPADGAAFLREVITLLERNCEPNSAFDAHLFFFVYMPALILSDRRLLANNFALSVRFMGFVTLSLFIPFLRIWTKRRYLRLLN